jgi:predicted DCC family thiol-disulfide oxidoreductase YuxK
MKVWHDLRSSRIRIPQAMTQNVDAKTPSISSVLHPTQEPQQACLTVYHDGSCPLCQREIALVKSLAHQGAIEFRDVSSRDAGEQVEADLTAADAMGRFHVRRADGTLLSGAAAFIAMWSASPRLRFLSVIGRSRTAVAMLDGIYAVFLKLRPSLSQALRRYDQWRAGASS